jgi:hypothetical protein
MIAVSQLTGRPGGSTGTSRARRRVSHGARRVARGSLLLTTGTACAALDAPTGACHHKIIQRRRQCPRRPGRDQSEQVVAIVRNRWSRSPECAVRVAVSRRTQLRLSRRSRLAVLLYQ